MHVRLIINETQLAVQRLRRLLMDIILPRPGRTELAAGNVCHFPDRFPLRPASSFINSANQFWPKARKRALSVTPAVSVRFNASDSSSMSLVWKSFKPISRVKVGDLPRTCAPLPKAATCTLLLPNRLLSRAPSPSGRCRCRRRRIRCACQTPARRPRLPASARPAPCA